MTPEELSYAACIRALSKVGERYVKNLNLDPVTSARFIAAEVEPVNLPDWITDPVGHEDEAGPLAKTTLRDMLDAGGRLKILAQTAINEEGTDEGHVIVETVLAGMFLLALASKVSYSKEGGPKIAPGFPQLAEVLDKAAKLLSSVAS